MSARNHSVRIGTEHTNARRVSRVYYLPVAQPVPLKKHASEILVRNRWSLSAASPGDSRNGRRTTADAIVQIANRRVGRMILWAGRSKIKDNV